MLPMIEKEVVERRGWASAEEIMDIFALSQSLPGAIAINSSIFLGYRLAGGHRRGCRGSEAWSCRHC